MTKTPKTKASSLLARQRTPVTAGARLDLILPRGWPQATPLLLWHLRAHTGEVQSGQGTLKELPSIGPMPVVVWTPATETLLTRKSLPTRSRAKLEQALPYALEEQLLDDPTQLHFAWRREDDGTLFVAVTAKQRLQDWLAVLQQSGIKPAALCPATLAVPWSPDCWSAAYVGDELLVRTGPVSGFSTTATVDEPAGLLVANLNEARAGSRAPEYLIVFQPPPGFRADTWRNALGVPVRVEPQPFWHVPGDSQPALNLLQGAFAPAGELRKHLRPWLPAAALFGVWLLGTVALDVTEWWRLNRMHNQHTREMTELLLSAFPETKTVLDPAQQMQRALETVQARGGMRAQDILPLLSRVTRAWQTDPRLRLRGLRYADRSLTLEVTVPDGEAMENLRRALQSNGLQAEVLASTPRAGEVEGRIRIRPPTAVSSAKP